MGLLERPTALEVRIVAAEGRRVVRAGLVPPGGRLELRYRHSVERTPVVEVFRAEPDGLWFVEMRFLSQGAGLPTEGYVREGGLFVLRRPRRIGEVPLLVSAEGGHRLRVGQDEVDLVAAFGEGAAVRLVSAPAGWRLRRPRPAR
ncbi:MAG: DUF1850 domain-containing protein [Armatimonadota bacterium]|nr:DUF1850 domain-containing protein [Armatimonadota bacterium]MDR7420845.1 DUF1850 domain-containing protein [Armatimonadota bacterium]MDR7457678.1 DUF1850 domain-containing protein [Armatimonadota bacterium]MDR7495589.1 DUF1850 domain-containing protein [Armatimonadota bacterium]MDR7512735.1 DUF1850 domain-containing protein [Armatimonadota bacterium]